MIGRNQVGGWHHLAHATIGNDKNICIQIIILNHDRKKPGWGMTPSSSWDDWEWHEAWRHNGRGRQGPPNHPQSSSMDHPFSSNPAIWFCARMWNCENSKTIEFHQSIWLNTLSAKKYRSSEKSFENEVSLKPQPFPPWQFSFVIFHWRCCINSNVFHLGYFVFAMHFKGVHFYQ